MRKLLLFLTTAFLANALIAQDHSGYQLPPKDISDLLLAKPTPAVSIDRKGEWMLLSERNSYPSVEELAQPELRLGGLRFNPNNYALSRQNFINDFSLKNLKTGKEYKVQGLPTPLLAGNVSRSPSEGKIAFTNTTNKEVDLYVIDIATQKATRVNKSALNTIVGGGGGRGEREGAYQWIDDKTIIYKIALHPVSAAPAKKLVPEGPTIQENMGKSAPSRTFEDMIHSPYDEAIFAFYGESQLVKNTGGVETPIGKPGIFTSVNISPDKKYILLRTVHKPFSYIVPVNQFNSTVSVCDINGGIVILSACGKTTRRIVSMKPRPMARPASICSFGIPRMPLRMSSDM